jgi:hypothetical protein
MEREFAGMVRYLAVPAVGLTAQGMLTENKLPVVRKFKNLRELTVICGDEAGENDFYLSSRSWMESHG